MKRMVLVLAGALIIAGCGDDLLVPDFNNPSLEELTTSPTRAKIGTAATGMLIGARDGVAARNGYVSLLGILGRESYNFDGADPRFITEMLEGELFGSSPAFGGNLWNQRYRNIRTGEVILNALDNVANMTDAEKEATRGFVKTIQAHEFLLVLNTRDSYGAVIDVDRPPGDEPGAVVGKPEVFTHIVTLLDEARTHLLAGGTEFPFALSSGFAEFNTPTTFAQFNRALKARVDVYRDQFASALTALQQSFVSTTTSLDRGVYHVYSTGSGDDQNALYDPGDEPDILAHRSIVTDAERKPDGSVDDRVTRKIRSVASQTQRGITTDVAFRIYESLSARLPIIRNEELILLRAEANIGLNNLAAAATDINFIRTTSGGLPPLLNFALLTQDQARTELLKQKRFSLMFEGGHRWIDMRHYNRLAQLPLDVQSHRVNPRFPIPEAECLPRTTQPAGCQ